MQFLQKLTGNKQLVRFLLVLVILGAYYVTEQYTSTRSAHPTVNAGLNEAIEYKYGDVQVEGRGAILKVLKDDNYGSRHQRFLVKLDSGHVILISHNIDLAPRVESLKKGETVSFFGEYEWNDKGGVVHWTHHDPKKWHPDGWIKYQGKTYF